MKPLTPKQRHRLMSQIENLYFQIAGRLDQARAGGIDIPDTGRSLPELMKASGEYWRRRRLEDAEGGL